MPATVAHAFFAQDVCDILPEEINRKIDLNLCKTFAQSVDSLMFYNLFSIFPGKKIREFDKYFHRNKSQDFFINLLTFIRGNKINDIDTLSFLIGFICHYALDSTMHPFIIYKTGIFDKKKPNTYKYNNIHAFMETFIDNDIIRRRIKTNPYKYKHASNCIYIKPFSNNLNRTIDYTFYNTFKMNNMDKIYYKSLKQMSRAINIFRRDPHGIKRFLYKCVDTFTPKSCYRFEAISYYYPLDDKHNFLNSNHSLWRNPAVYDITSNESFVDLYLKAIKYAKVLICASFDFLNHKDIELEKIFTNNSYVTGLSCNNKKELKYFEF